MIELTRNQKIGFGFGAAIILVIVIVVIYFVFIKKDTPTPTSTNTLTPTNTNSLLKSDKIKELEQIYKDAQTNYEAAKKAYDDAEQKNTKLPSELPSELADANRKILNGLNIVVMNANSALERARQNLEYASK
jgi:hypothetical protein